MTIEPTVVNLYDAVSLGTQNPTVGDTKLLSNLNMEMNQPSSILWRCQPLGSMCNNTKGFTLIDRRSGL